MKNRILRLLPALIAIIVAGVVFCYSHISSSGPVIEIPVDDNEEADVSAEENISDGNDIWVYVCGAVNDPGVFLMDKGARVFEAVEMAGGFTENAARDNVNLALPVEDGQQIIIPDISESENGTFNGLEDDGLININTASMEQLMTLPGIGQAKAQAIIEYREKRFFDSIEDIMNVSGIKENSFEKIKDRIKV